MIVCLAILFLAGTANAGIGQSWTYADNGGGFFEDRGNGNWKEFVNNAGGVTFQFKEVRRTANSVLLFDASRTLWVEIFETTSYVRHAGTPGWVFLYSGRWNE
jgi:hypothetical protein